MMFELPPILRGSEKDQIVLIRDYLVRLARNLGDVSSTSQVTVSTTQTAATTPAGTAKEQSEEDKLASIRRNAANLRALIVKTAADADTLAVELGAAREEMQSYYLAKSDFGAYMEQVESTFAATARGVVESYDFRSLIDAVDARTEELNTTLTSLRGEIRRGIITDPGTGEQALGIAVAENLQFTGTVHEEDGLQYYELSPGQTLGLYTSTGWQFWVNGSKRGWFDSADGSLHVVGEVVENSLQLGDGWAFSAVGGLGIKYTGD